MEGKGGSHRETLTWVHLPNWMRGSNLSAQCYICARKGPRAAESGPRLQLLQAQEQKSELPKPSCCYIFWTQIDCPEQCPRWHCHGVHLPSASLSPTAHTYITSHLQPSFGFVCTPGWGEAFLHCMSWMAPHGEAEEGLYTPVHLPAQSFGDDLCMTVGGGEFEHKGLSTWSAAPENPPMLGISYSQNSTLLKFTRPPFTLKYKWRFWGIFHKSENHRHPSFMFTSKYRQDVKWRANGVAHLHINTYVCAPHTCSSSSPEEDLLVRKSRPWLLCLPRLRTSLTAPWIAQLVKWIYYIKSKRLNYHRQPIISWRSQGSISLLLTL